MSVDVHFGPGNAERERRRLNTRMSYPTKPYDFNSPYPLVQNWSHLADDDDDAGQEEGGDEYTPSGSDAGVLKREENQRKWIEIQNEIRRMEELIAQHTGTIAQLQGYIATLTASIAQKKVEMSTL
jgi:hypothetical protein